MTNVLVGFIWRLGYSAIDVYYDINLEGNGIVLVYQTLTSTWNKTHMFLVNRLCQEADHNGHNAHDPKQQDAKMQIVYFFDNIGRRIGVAARHLGIAAFGNETRKADGQTDHESPEGSLKPTQENG